MSGNIKEQFRKNRIIPVAVFDDVDNALKIAELLLKNGLDILEVTLRTIEAFNVIEQISKKFPDIIIGAGSVLSADSLQRAYDSGVIFGVSPCLDFDVLDCAKSLKLTFVPGISTPSELNHALKRSDIIKIFPAEKLGGIDYLNAITAPFKMNDFYLVPTGGINNINYIDYLNTEKVISCGMTYIVDKKLTMNKDFKLIDKRIKEIVSGLSEISG